MALQTGHQKPTTVGDRLLSSVRVGGVGGWVGGGDDDDDAVGGWFEDRNRGPGFYECCDVKAHPCLQFLTETCEAVAGEADKLPSTYPTQRPPAPATDGRIVNQAQT